MDRRVHVVERELVRRHLSVRMHVPLTQEQDELLLREGRVDARQWQGVKGEVPCRVPWILPLVGHRDDVGVVDVRPLRIPSRQPRRRWSRIPGIARQPFLHGIMVELLGPEQPGERLPIHRSLLGREGHGNACREKRIRLFTPGIEGGRERRAKGGRQRRTRRAQPQGHGHRRQGRHVEYVVRGGFCSGPSRIHRVALARYDIPMECILHVRRRIGDTIQHLLVRVVFREQEFADGTV